jgi:hypothetical protein
MDSQTIIKMEKDIEYIRKEQIELKVMLKESRVELDIKLDKIITQLNDRFERHEEVEIQNIRDVLKAKQEQDKQNEQKFARKYIENAFWWALSVVGTLLITALMYVILK